MSHHSWSVNAPRSATERRVGRCPVWRARGSVLARKGEGANTRQISPRRHGDTEEDEREGGSDVERMPSTSLNRATRALQLVSPTSGLHRRHSIGRQCLVPCAVINPHHPCRSI